jgi:SNF2 family DNA or RNA helicase
MTVALMEHQKEGVAFLTGGRRGLLAFEQGLGKTLVAIDSFRQLRERNEADRMLVICPNSLKRNWVAEIAKFAPSLIVAIAEGTPKTRRAVFAGSTASVIVTSYETARTEVTAILAFASARRTVLVLDESHAAKNWRSLTSASMRHFAPRCDYRWLLSGTPVTNTPADLYTQIEIIAPGERSLGSLETFLARVEEDPSAKFAKPVLDRLVLRRTKDDCLDLPEKTFSDVVVELPSWQRKLYDDMRDEMVCAIRDMSGAQYSAFASTALAQLTRLSQLASNPALLFPENNQTPAKFDVIDGVVADIMSVPGRKVIIWSTYIKNIEALRVRLATYGAVAIYGGVEATERQEVANRFQNDPETRVLIANPAAAGTGFTLTAASYTIYESMSWRYDHYAQSQDRNHRIGQTQPVTYIRLLGADTIDEAVARALERKSGMARNLLSDPDAQVMLSRFTPEDMCNLITNNALPQTLTSSQIPV